MEEDQQELEEKYQIPDYFLSDISDTDERPVMNMMTVGCLSSPYPLYVKEAFAHTITTVPLGIIHKRDITITVCNFETNMMIDFVSYHQNAVPVSRIM